MNYLFYFIIFCSLLGIFLIPLIFQYYLKIDFIYKKTMQNILKQKPVFFSEYLIRKIVITAIRQHSKEKINLLLQGKLLTIAQKIQKKNPLQARQLKAFFQPEKNIKFLENAYKKTKNAEIAVFSALIYEAMQNKSKAELFWDQITEKQVPKNLKSYYFAHLAQTALKNGDLEYASQCFYQVVELFHKSKSFYEEAETYIHLGTIYRMAFINDIAEVLFLSALKLYNKLKYQDGIAKTYAHLGMLMSGQERFDEAENYFKQAETQFAFLQQHIEEAEVKNQQALMWLLEKEYKKAQKYVQAAEKQHKKYKNIVGIAFSSDIKANISWQQNNFFKTAEQAAIAAGYYKQCNQISGELDSLYLQAQALYKEEKDVEAEKILRTILQKGKENSGCFYLANAYNLLGIIYVKRKDLSRAKGLFQQSLDLEQRGVRINALAADYANIGLVEMCCGHKETARKNLETALRFATDIEDKELMNLLQNHLNRLNN